MVQHFGFLALLSAITTTVICFQIPKHLYDQPSPSSSLRHQVFSPTHVVRTDLIPSIRAGYTFDLCKNNTDCLGKRLCFNFRSENTELCGGTDSCECRPRDGKAVFCTNVGPCDSGEVCASRGNETFPVCVSTVFANRNRWTIVSVPPGDGFTRDLCSDNTDCAGDRVCRYAFNTREICDDRDPCFCLIPNGGTSCCTDEECIPEEVCAEDTEIEEPRQAFCIAPLAVARERNWELTNCSMTTPPPPTTPSPTTTTTTTTTTTATTTTTTSTGPTITTTGKAVTPPPPTTPPPPSSTEEVVIVTTPVPCIAVHMLDQFTKSELAFQNHVLAPVLCDEQMSCATSGHIVVYEGQPLMMSSYCKVVGCNKQVMHVNSPRYRKKQRVPSKTQGLEFTAFAARYGTTLEQYVMTFAVKMGL